MSPNKLIILVLNLLLELSLNLAISPNLQLLVNNSSACLIDNRYWDIINWYYGSRSDIAVTVFSKSLRDLEIKFIGQLFSSIIIF